MGWNSTYYRNEAQFVKLGMSARFLIEPIYSSYIDKMKEWHERGTFTDITFFVFGKWNSRTKARLHQILIDNGNDWAWNHLVFRLGDEVNDVSFLLKSFDTFKISHYVDMDKDHITPIVMSKHYLEVKIFYWHKAVEQGWEEFKDWLHRQEISRWKLFDKGEMADAIINTGFAKSNKSYPVTSGGYVFNYDLEAT